MHTTLGTADNRSHASVDAMVDAFSQTACGCSPLRQLQEWMHVATSGGTPQFLSLFDRENGTINTVAIFFNFECLLPADLKGKCPIGL